MSGIVKIEVITGMSKLTDLIQNLSKVGVRGATVMQVLGCGIGTYGPLPSPFPPSF